MPGVPLFRVAISDDMRAWYRISCVSPQAFQFSGTIALAFQHGANVKILSKN